MDSTMRARVLTMAAAALGLSVVGGCAKKAPEEPAAEASSGAETAAPEEGAAAGTTEEGAAQGGEMGCGGANGCHAAK
jgi:hypothetical protein